MDKSIELTKPVFEALIEHLIYMEESADRLADFYFPDSPEDRQEIKDFFKYYIKAIESQMENVSVVKSFKEACCMDTLNTFPFVIIGSVVELETVPGKEVQTFRLIHPDSHSTDKNGITYLSAFGKALLLRKTGCDIDMDTPDAPQRYKIKSIKLLA